MWSATRSHNVGPTSGLVVGPISHLVGFFSTFFVSTDPSWPKTNYIPLFRNEVVQKHEKIWNKSKDYENRWGDATRAIPGCPIASIDTIFFITMMKME
jgi:hypothetical protein